MEKWKTKVITILITWLWRIRFLGIAKQCFKKNLGVAKAFKGTSYRYSHKKFWWVSLTNCYINDSFRCMQMWSLNDHLCLSDQLDQEKKKKKKTQNWSKHKALRLLRIFWSRFQIKYQFIFLSPIITHKLSTIFICVLSSVNYTHIFRLEHTLFHMWMTDTIIFCM